MSDLSPNDVLKQIAGSLPAEFRKHVIIVGSLAAAYHFPRDSGERRVATKDVDFMVVPHAAAVVTAQEVTNRLIDAEWSLRPHDKWGTPGTPEQPTDALPAVRLQPPDSKAWFLELLGAPDESKPPRLEREMYRLHTSIGDFALVSFGFLGLVQHDAVESEYGIRIATPAMMALANLLHHPEVGPQVIEDLPYFGQKLRRASKDLGRVIALARLGGRAQTDTWAERWARALQSMHPAQAAELAQRVGSGLKDLLSNAEFVAQALYTCNLGLLAGQDLNEAQFRGTAQVVLADAIAPLEQLVQRGRDSDRPPLPRP